MKRIIIGLLLIGLLLTPITTNANTISFTDINGQEWYYEDLMSLATEGIVSGIGNGSFNGTGLLTKDALIKTLVVANGTDPGNASGYWAQNYIDYADSMGWLDGLTDRNYTGAIDRYETCLLIVNAIGDSETYPFNLSQYDVHISDYSSIPETYKDVVLKVYSLGIITGYPDGSFSGDNTLSRAEMAAILSRYINDSRRKPPLDPIKVGKLDKIMEGNPDQVFAAEFIQVTDNQLSYYDYESDSWKALSSTGLRPDMARKSEDILIEVAYYVHEETDLVCQALYSYGNFYMYILDDNMQAISYSLDDNSSKVTISIPDLYNAPPGDVQSEISKILTKMLRGVDELDYVEIYNYIKDHYIVNKDAEPIIYSQFINGTGVVIRADMSGYQVEITLND